MPIYEYDCADCGEHFEVAASMTSGRGKVHCASCASERVRRDYGGISVVRHGGGAGRASAADGPAPGQMRVADPRRLATNVATNYANQTGDRVMREVAKRADAGAEPDRLHEFVREVKADRESASGKHGVRR